MPRIIAKADNLNERNAEFAQTPLTAPTFLNSVPKSGTHLIRNIVRMFVPVDQQYHETFIQIPILGRHLAAFSREAPRLSWGHLLFSDDSAIALSGVRHVLLVRDPYDWVLARARFMLSDNFQANLEHLKKGRQSVDELLNMMIFGIHQKAPNLLEIYTHNAVAWLGTAVRLVRYEDLVGALKALDSLESHAYFASLLKDCGVDPLPEDWRARVLIGSDRGVSATARENLRGVAADLPAKLPDTQRRLVDFHAPGLRALLGYS